MSRKEPIVKNIDDVKIEKVDRGDDVFIKRLIASEENVENCFMRKFTIKSGGSMPYHEHEETDHVQYILKGKMKVNLDGETHFVEQNDFLYIPPETPHSYENPYDEEIKFICIVPSGEIKTKIESDPE